MIDGVKPVGAEWVYDAVSIGFAVLHVAVRAPRGISIVVDGRDVVPEVHAVLDAITEFSNRVSNGVWKGYTGERIRNVVNIAIGGPNSATVMAYEALRYYSDRATTFRFVSNVDGTDSRTTAGSGSAPTSPSPSART